MSAKPLADMGKTLGELTQSKNEVYGDSFERSGKILNILYPEGVKPEQYQDMLGTVRVLDKLFRIATRKNALGESPWKDIAGYGILGAAADDKVMKKGLAEISRLGEEQESQPKPHKFKVGDIVEVDTFVGKITKYDDNDDALPWLVQFSQGETNWYATEELKHFP